MTQRPKPSSAFAHRELNGEHLLRELRDLRLGQVTQRQLAQLAAALGQRTKLGATELAHELRALAKDSFGGHSAITALLREWTQKLSSDDDVAVLIGHAQRLAMTSALTDVLRKVSANLGSSKP